MNAGPVNAGPVNAGRANGGRVAAAGGERPLGELCEQVRQVVTEVTGPLRRIRLRSGDTVLEIEWQDVPVGEVRPPVAARPALADEPAAAGTPLEPTGRGGATPAATPRRAVVSPIVGTFYRSPEPGAPPYVEVGDTVEPGEVIGIVEAMKLMNQVTAEQAGTVAEVLVADGEPVEFEQPLIVLVPA